MWFKVKRGTIEKTLRNFGLSEKQAEIYIFLGKRGPLKGGEITKRLKMNKGQVYRILRKLQKKGLVEETLEFPARFIAVPFEKVIDSFVKSKREEVDLIEETKKDLLSDWNKISQIELDSSLEKFSVIEGKKKIFNKISQMINETNNQFSMKSTVSDLFRAEQFGVFETLNKHPMKSKIQFRVLTQTSKQNLKAIKLLKTKLKPILDFRGKNPSLGSPTFTRMAIRDNDEIVLFISYKDKEPLKDGKEVCLCTNCKSIIEAFSGVFEDSWKDSTDIEDRITEIETGKPPTKTQLIKDPISAKKTYYELLNSAKDEILLVTSSEGLIEVLNDRLRIMELCEKGVVVRVMSPITGENLGVAQQLLEFCEVRHIPVGYLKTTIIDGHHLFQFRYPSKDQKLEKDPSFEYTFYTNDFDYVHKTKNLIFDIWRKTRIPSDVPLQSISFLSVSKKETHRPLRKCDRYGLKKMEFTPMGKISEKDVLDKFNKAKKNASTNWSNISLSDTLCFLGSRAFAFIRPPDYFALPDMIIGIFQNVEASSFGVENFLKVFLMPEMTKNAPYPLIAHVQDNPKSLAYREALLAGIPGGKNIILVNKDQLKVRVYGNTLFAGWTVPIPLIPSKYILPPSCILFEGHGDVRSGIFNFIFPSGRKQEAWFNSYEAFVTFFHPSSKYVGPGTEGWLDRESVQISYPSQPDIET